MYKYKDCQTRTAGEVPRHTTERTLLPFSILQRAPSCLFAAFVDGCILSTCTAERIYVNFLRFSDTRKGERARVEGKERGKEIEREREERKKKEKIERSNEDTADCKSLIDVVGEQRP